METIFIAFDRALLRLRLVRALSERKIALIFEIHSSIGLKSGEYASKCHDAAAVGQRGDITPLTLLAQQFVDEGFVNTEHPGNFPFGCDSSFHSVNNSFSKV